MIFFVGRAPLSDSSSALKFHINEYTYCFFQLYRGTSSITQQNMSDSCYVGFLKIEKQAHLTYGRGKYCTDYILL